MDDDEKLEARREGLRRLVAVVKERVETARADDLAESSVITRTRLAHASDVHARAVAALEALDA